MNHTTKYIATESIKQCGISRLAFYRGEFVCRELSELSDTIKGAWVKRSQVEAVTIEQEAATRQGELLVIDNGNWSRSGRYHKDEYRIEGTNAVFVGTQHYWTSQRGELDTEGAGTVSPLRFDKYGDISI